MRDFDLLIEVPVSTMIEIRDELTFPGARNNSEFDQLKHSGRLFDLSGETRRLLFYLSDTIEHINWLRHHRETLPIVNAGNVHNVIDPSEFELESGTTVMNEDLPSEIQ